MKNAHKYRSLAISVAISLCLVFVLNQIFLTFNDFWKLLLIGKKSFGEGISFQDVMWFMFFIGVCDIFIKVREILELEKFKDKKYLPSKFEDLIDEHALTKVIKAVKSDAQKPWGVLPYMILQISLQYRTNFSIALISDFLSKQLELFLHQIELKFNNLKYIIWLIPSIGFMGTVYGIGLAVNQLGQGSIDDPELLTMMAQSLGIAFNTTLLALILAVILQFLSQHFEGREEQVINDYGKYILDNLINKIVEK